ncbi:MAG: hypothetical protein LBC21_02645 [Oscillospiraceae bacterium]|jgi:hypothetical protein|nr:hypothetical protein [Oscillospiraceae bacterium]
MMRYFNIAGPCNKARHYMVEAASRYCSLETAQGIVDPREGIPEIVRKIQNTLRLSGIPEGAQFAREANYVNFSGVLNTELSLFCKLLDKPLVILFDEADCLSEGTLISFLRQLRDGYVNRVEIPHRAKGMARGAHARAGR